MRRLADGGDVARAFAATRRGAVDRGAWRALLRGLTRRAVANRSPVRPTHVPRMAKAALAAMARRGLAPGAREVTSAIAACVAAGAPREGLRAFDAHRVRDGDARLYNAALRAANAARDEPAADRALRRMAADGVARDAWTAACVRPRGIFL